MTNLVRKQRKQNNVSEWGDTSTSGLLFQWARTIKETIKRVGLVQSRHHHNFFEYNLHSLTHSLTHSLAHSLTHSSKGTAFYWCSTFHSHNSVFNTNSNLYPIMSVKQSQACSWAVFFTSFDKRYIWAS